MIVRWNVLFFLCPNPILRFDISVAFIFKQGGNDHEIYESERTVGHKGLLLICYRQQTFASFFLLFLLLYFSRVVYFLF